MKTQHHYLIGRLGKPYFIIMTASNADEAISKYNKNPHWGIANAANEIDVSKHIDTGRILV